MTMWLTIAAIVVLAVLGRSLFRRFGADEISTFNERRRASSKVVGRGELVDGNRHLDVALAMTRDTFFYENAQMQASIDLQFVREVDYDNELATGGAIAEGKVLRMRTRSRTFEFVLPAADVARWHLLLPPRRTETPGIPSTGAIDAIATPAAS